MGSIFSLSMSNNGSRSKCDKEIYGHFTYKFYNNKENFTHKVRPEFICYPKRSFFNNYEVKLQGSPIDSMERMKEQLENEGYSVSGNLVHPYIYMVKFDITSDQYNAICDKATIIFSKNATKLSENDKKEQKDHDENHGLKIKDLPGLWFFVRQNKTSGGGKKTLKQKKAHRLIRHRSLRKSQM